MKSLLRYSYYSGAIVAIPEYCKNSNRPKHSDCIKDTRGFRFVRLSGGIICDVISSDLYCTSLNFRKRCSKWCFVRIMRNS